MSQLNDLTDELILSILSFIVELPFEDSESSISKHSNLTHVFPLINKRFHSLCLRSDSLWKMGVERLIKNQPELWGKFLINRMSNGTPSSTPKSHSQAPAPLITLNEQNEEDDYRYKYASFNNNKSTNLRSSYTQPQIGYHHQIYHDTFQKDIITKQPFLYDSSDQIIPSTGIRIGVEMDVYFDQMEQVTFMAELIKGFLQRNPQFGGVNGGFGGIGGVELVFPNDNDDDDDDIRPTFIYLNGFKKRKNKKKKKKNEEEEEDHDHPCAKDQVGQIAYKVKVTQCILYPDHSGHVNFIPVSYVRIKSVSQQRDDPARTTTTTSTTNGDNEDDNDGISNNNIHNDVILYDARVIGIKRNRVEKRRSSACIILDSTVKNGRSIAYRFGLIFNAIFCVISSLILINIYCLLNLIFTSGETLFNIIWNHGVGSVIAV